MLPSLPSLAARAPFAVVAVLALLVAAPADVGAQALDDPSRLTGITTADVEVSAVWDELITTSAGGATADQFELALRMGLEAAIDSAAAAPTRVQGAPDVIQCHVDTFYESSLVIYSVRVSLMRPDTEGRPLVHWLRSWVGSYTSQQLHVIWSLADQCADTFLDAWVEANGG